MPFGFLWCISSTTKEIERDGETWGIVLGNKPLKAAELALQFGVNEKRSEDGSLFSNETATLQSQERLTE